VLLGFGSSPGLHDRWMQAELGFTRGRSLQKQNRPSEGLVEIRKAIEINPDDFQNHFIEALNYNSMGRTKEAIASIEESVKLYPNLLNAWVNLAMFNRRAGDDKKMLAAIQTALKLKPDELVAVNTWAQWLEDKGQSDEELALLRPQLCADKVPNHKGVCPAGRMGYVPYRKLPEWPTDDGDQLLGAYKTALRHASTAAHKLAEAASDPAAKRDLYAEAAVYFQLLDDESVPARESQAAKKKQWIQMASDVAESWAKAGQWDKALPYTQRAAELAEQARPELKLAYTLALARTGNWTRAGQESQVVLALDASQRASLIEALQAVRQDRPQDQPAADAVLQSLQAAAAPAAATEGAHSD
jgi:hypothetical protein